MDWGKLVEEKIRDAQKAGDFDSLPKLDQLNLDDEKGVPEDMQLAYHLLKNQGFAPQWIEQDKALRAKLDEARQTIARSWLWYQGKLAHNPTPQERTLAAETWQRAREKFEQVLQELNREVFLHNLRVPSLQLQRRPLRVSEEYQALGIKP